MKDALALFALSAVACALFSYGGIRSPDGEVNFRTAEALAHTGSSAVDTELGWKGFGLATGRDGRRYSIFGPLLPALAAPWVVIGEAVADASPFAADGVPVSFYIGEENRIFDRSVRDARPHAVRFVVAQFNVVATAAAVALFYWIALALCGSRTGAWIAALGFGLGSIALPYASLFMGEPLATGLTLGSFAALLRIRADASGGGSPAALAGLMLGLATLAHITAILFAPFFAAIVALETDAAGSRGRRMLAFSAGLVIPLLWLAGFNYARFGDVLETGRTMPDSAGFGYGVFVSPFGNLFGLLFGLGKGLLPYCPIVVVALFGLRSMWRERPVLVAALTAAALLRVVFIAARSDWHGGFGIGPRYLAMLVPFLVLPLAFLSRDIVASGRTRSAVLLGATVLACIVQQFYFAMHDIFTYSHRIRVTGGRQGVNVFANDFIYLAWEVSPLHRLHEIGLGSYALTRSGLDEFGVWTLLAASSGAAAAILAWVFLGPGRAEAARRVSSEA